MDGLTNIYLTGRLAKAFKPHWQLRVSSVAEAIRAIDVNTGGKLRAFLAKDGNKKFYKVALGKKDALLSRDELGNRSGSSDIYIMPTVQGSGSSGGKILAGIALIVLTYFTYGAGSGLAAGGAGLGGLTVGQTALIGYGLGASLVLGGITQLLTPAPNFDQNSAGDSRGSSIFPGNATAVSQGGAVGVIYGRALVTPMPICISYDNQDVPITTSTPIDQIGSTQLPGGGYQYPQE